MTDDDVLSDKQRRALPIFCIQLNIEKACAEAGISKQTFYQWMRNPLFKRELKEMRREIGTPSSEQLKSESKKAAETLAELLDRSNPPSVRRAAANDILTYVLKFRENESSLLEFFGDD